LGWDGAPKLLTPDGDCLIDPELKLPVAAVDGLNDTPRDSSTLGEKPLLAFATAPAPIKAPPTESEAKAGIGREGAWLFDLLSCSVPISGEMC
jgi:hypothetical protein